MINVIFTLLLSNVVLIKNDTINPLELISEENLINVDTINFSGIVVLDQIDNNSYFMSTEGSNKIKLKYKSKDKFDSNFKNREQVPYLSSRTLEFVLKKYKSDSVISGECSLHIPSCNGISVFESDKGRNIYISFYTGQLYKTSIRGDVVNQLHLLGLNQMVDDKAYVDFYTFTEIHW